ncbi:gluconate 2-dehydrogenase subunit 3 family protein [Pedobacter sp. V48]|uniref:gluconate 2-dehydrogenase subunit 3 family protein n=1 Tax=Pedobacter sp. V48 TaxID=509635 RepID=UPI0003E4C721|nr:gluconate 2-dehydrogenase subunit 3 family protein [Pedobacter sp. V48]ETZ22607.1 hypothetical protein N824_22290 [Pedobacter sp. V48]
MNRRKAIFGILGFSAIAAGGASVWKFYNIHKAPNLDLLVDKKLLIAQIAETIIPGGETPGAKAVKAEDFIIKMVRDCTEIKSQNRFIYGLKELEDYTIANYGKPFTNCNVNDRIQILTYFEDRVDSNRFVHKVKKKIYGESFIYMIKSYTVAGYCTSKLGATQGLAYDYVPSVFESCLPLLPGQRSWATK